jgi:hypothetical protein
MQIESIKVLSQFLQKVGIDGVHGQQHHFQEFGARDKLAFG